MILLFLSSWRSTFIICVSIPLSILCSIVVLSMLGETINIMTLGGMALAVGILVDDATVEMENIHRNMAEGGSMHDCILRGASQIAVPAFVSTLCICIVFVPIFFLTGTARTDEDNGITGTTVSVPALMGTIMCMGVATSNSVLMITFANEKLHESRDSYQAALQAGYIRVRPVIMTALAMIIGMVPMALGLGEGGEQNAPLGRAVIGGLILATVGTLFFVPTVFMMMRRHYSFPEQTAKAEPTRS